MASIQLDGALLHKAKLRKLGIKNLSSTKHALLSKNLFTVLNNSDKLWVKIFNVKNPRWRFFAPFRHNSSLWLCKTITHTTEKLVFNFKLNICNPSLTSLWDDPWLHDILVAKKPTSFNMHDSLDSLTIEDFTGNGHWNFFHIEFFMGSNVNLDWLNKVLLNNSLDNHWIWWPKPNCLMSPLLMSSTPFSMIALQTFFLGWAGKKWQLEVSTRVKNFI